ncbi:hypothetical protein [Hymenobacter glacieicola]|uniref:DUF433 domain-containing protein n=1 Tax=Hymenobacter glacieicola TaxID=1562124 RepID=A0ABQ1WJP9_9BACT|nr:hypothetical protein [Hymenobacter glacieicola]GGG33240.1 hypothetical protein GCM10011378_07080 [Hymenobacter glacieicola]
MGKPLKPKDAVTITAKNRVRIRLEGTGPKEAYDAMIRYLDMVNPVLATNKKGITADTASVYESASLVLDLYEFQILPQMRLDALPEVLKLNVTRIEALRLWWLAASDPTGVGEQIQWIRALNEVHQKLG